MAQCSSCGRELTEIQRFCPQCGTPVAVTEEEPVDPAPDGAEAEEVAAASPTPLCAACGAELEGEERFCGECGAAVAGEGAAMPAPASAAAPPVVPTCAACGGEIGATAQFCGHCGATIAAAAGGGATAVPARPPMPVAGTGAGASTGSAPSAGGSFLEKLDTNDRIIVGGGIAALIASFLPWFSFEYGGYSMSAWSSGFYWAWFAVIVCVGIAVVVVLPALGVDLPARSREAVRTPLAAAAILFTALKFLTKPEGYNFGVGIFLCLAATIAVTVGCYRKEQEAKH